MTKKNACKLESCAYLHGKKKREKESAGEEWRHQPACMACRRDKTKYTQQGGKTEAGVESIRQAMNNLELGGEVVR